MFFILAICGLFTGITSEKFDQIDGINEFIILKYSEIPTTTFSAAKNECEKLDSKLAIIRNPEQKKAVQDIIENDAENTSMCRHNAAIS